MFRQTFGQYYCPLSHFTFFFLSPAPCPPENVVFELDCGSNTAQVDWQPSSGAEHYIVQGFGVEGGETSCETNYQSCVLPDLNCSFTYNISVIAANSVCNVSQSNIEQLNAGKNQNEN